jgi:hypothetical protein
LISATRNNKKKNKIDAPRMQFGWGAAVCMLFSQTSAASEKHATSKQSGLPCPQHAVNAFPHCVFHTSEQEFADWLQQQQEKQSKTTTVADVSASTARLLAQREEDDPNITFAEALAVADPGPRHSKRRRWQLRVFGGRAHCP